MYASPFDNYWVVADQPANLRWSSAAVAYVADTDATYLAWIAAGFEASYIDTEQELADLLNETYPAGSPIPAPPASTALRGPISITAIAPAGAQTGSFTVPAGVYKLDVTAQAPGGAGGNSTAATAQVGGAGGAGETRQAILAVSPGDILDYSIGAPGVPGTPGGDTTVTLQAAAIPAPAVLGSTAYFDGTAPTSQSYTLPPGIVAGDLLILLVHTQLAVSHLVTTPAGWTLVTNTLSGFHQFITYYKIAAGGETSVTISAAVPQGGCFRVVFSYRINGHDPATVPLCAGAQSNSTSANPPNLNASAWGAANKLWIAWAGSGHDVTGTPSGFGNGIGGPSAGNAFWGRSAYKQSNELTLDPSTYTAQAELWGAQTIAIRPTPPAALITAKCGTNGGGAAGGNSGAVGTTPTGSGGIRIPPTAPGDGLGSGTFVWSRGGSSLYGNGGLAIRPTTFNGQTGFGPGAGGSGAGNGSGTTAGTGGSGGPGMLLITGYGA